MSRTKQIYLIAFFFLLMLTAAFAAGCTTEPEPEPLPAQVTGTLEEINGNTITILNEAGESLSYETAEYLCYCHTQINDVHSSQLGITTQPLNHLPRGTAVTLNLENGGTLVTNLQSVLSDNPHEYISWQGVDTCLSCHIEEAKDMHESVHYQWAGISLGTAQGTTIGPALQGKIAGAFNTFCINILGNWETCGNCHVGLGLEPTAEQTQEQLENIDCLICHQQAYKRVEVNGIFQPDTAKMTITMDEAAQTVHRPVKANCLQCHAKGGGGDSLKRGDLSLAHAVTGDVNFDVHMATNGANLECVDCHIFNDHRAPGRGSDLRVSDSLIVPQCTDCHEDKLTSTGHKVQGVNNHVDKVACQTCHIPIYGKNADDTAASEATETHRTWLENEYTGTKYEPELHLANDVTPVYLFWNKNSYMYNMYDQVVENPLTCHISISRPLGALNDPASKLYAFKYKTSEQPYAPNLGQLIALDTSVFFKTGDGNAAAIAGLVNMGYSASELVEWIIADEYLMLNHEVAPKEEALLCGACHESTARIDLKALGYVLKDSTDVVCTQCHADKSGENLSYYRMHQLHSEEKGYDCANCHGFTRK
ncbi:MAG: hypothetical protein P3T54_00330 [Dehalogenimonas sp.]|uniref:Uncharacterized protein n=1 Tax=Candidatus Dehalogenimonas loeffleri TaxID=3127115 RepID=A0ABZ2J197_9CHLR|nr:hypothetical protein [Dehalogenimonas sp.]